MRLLGKVIFKLTLSILTTIFFIIGFIVYGAKLRTNSLFEIFAINFTLFSGIPLLVYSLYKKPQTIKKLFLLSLLDSLLIAVPLGLFIGGAAASYPMDEFDTSVFKTELFLFLFPAVTIIFFIQAYIVLILGGIIKLILAKNKNVDI